MSLPFYWIDAFTEKMFGGNPAGVVPLDRWLPDAQMQQIAFENGLAETAFFVRTGDASFHLRWFTPKVEVDLCGHATLATAFVIFTELGGVPGDKLTFETLSGPLRVARGAEGKLEMDFPATPVSEEREPGVAQAIRSALGRAPVWLGRSRFDRFAVLENAAAVRALEPDMNHVAAAGGRGLIVTAPGEADVDFVSRFFAPQSGIAEDPVTGSAHSALTPYWAARLGKTRFHARQLSPRGGELWCELAGDRVKISGQAVLYLRGRIDVPESIHGQTPNVER
jgi:PhzF family phenazine biosynthesis protein